MLFTFIKKGFCKIKLECLNDQHRKRTNLRKLDTMEYEDQEPYNLYKKKEEVKKDDKMGN